MDLFLAIQELDGITFKFLSEEKKKQIYSMRDELRKHVKYLKESKGIDVIENLKLSTLKIKNYIVFVTDHAFKVRYIVGRREKPVMILSIGYDNNEYDILFFKETGPGAKQLYDIICDSEGTSIEQNITGTSLIDINRKEITGKKIKSNDISELTFKKEMIGEQFNNEFRRDIKFRKYSRSVKDIISWSSSGVNVR